jgi:hypothetical protein
MITTKQVRRTSGINSLKNHFSFSWLLKNVFLFIAKSCLVYEKALQIIAFSKVDRNRASGGEGSDKSQQH